MISEKLQAAFNRQINGEMWSSNLYLAMSYYLAKEGYDGFAKWLKLQSQEELEHAYTLADFVVKRGGEVKIESVAEVPQSWATLLEVFEEVYIHECKISSMINDLLDIATADRDNAAQDLLWTYVREQVEEEASTQGIVEKLKRCQDHAGILYLDDKLGERN